MRNGDSERRGRRERERERERESESRASRDDITPTEGRWCI